MFFPPINILTVLLFVCGSLCLLSSPKLRSTVTLFISMLTLSFSSPLVEDRSIVWTSHTIQIQMKHSTAALIALCLPFRSQSQFWMFASSRETKMKKKKRNTFRTISKSCVKFSIDRWVRSRKSEWLKCEREKNKIFSWRWRWCCIFDFIACPYFSTQNTVLLKRNGSSYHPQYTRFYVFYGSHWSWFSFLHSNSHLLLLAHSTIFIDSYFTANTQNRKRRMNAIATTTTK